jgi:hypothetical protein
MKFTPHAAFGTVVILAQTNAGDTRVVPIAENGLVKTGWYYYTHGCAKVHVIETGEQLSDRNASSGGNLQLNFPVETEWLCIPHQYNKDGLPTLESFVVDAGSSRIIENNSNIFLVRGTLTIKGKDFVGPTQIRVRSGDIEATAKGNQTCYGVRFL